MIPVAIFFFFFGLSRLDLARNEANFVFRLFVFYFLFIITGHD